MNEKRMDPLKHTMKRKIRRQMGNTVFNRGVTNSAENGELGLKFLMVIFFLMNMVLSGSGLYFIMMIRSL